MYLVGVKDSPKFTVARLIERLIGEQQRLVTDTQVLQEILHRYVSINRRESIQPAFNAVLNLVDRVLPVEHATLEEAKEIVMQFPRLSARDAVHLAVMHLHGIDRILSYDAGFDALPGITRLS
jgi:predicted nucleic acid-binding protein